MSIVKYLQSTRRIALCLMLAALALAGLSAQEKRLALVVGNSAYQSNPLKNPVNDATDIAKALKDAGFQVTLLLDADLTKFEAAIKDFATAIKGADTGLFYYAGHGVQVDGMNFLIPVSPRIDSPSDTKAKSVAVDTVVAKMEDSGVHTALLFLDSCRDNPFPGASRSGTRGLAIVPTPKTVNSLIAYATSPGDTAQDGSGRNGVFSGAVLKYLQQPGLELGQLMKSVKAEVAQTTGNKQNPRVDDGMKEDFWFVSPDQLSQRSKAASDQAAKDLADLDRQVAERQELIASTKNASERQKLEVEQQRQQALQSAKKLEADNLKAEADKQAKAAAEARAIALQKANNDQATAKKQNDLSNLAAARRAELDKLAQDAASDNPDILIETVERLEKVLTEVDSQYAAALQKSLSASNATWDKQVAAISKQEPDITESDAEFADRINGEKSTLEHQRQAELTRLKNEAETQRTSQTASIRTQYNETLNTLQTKTWTLSGSAVVLSPGVFDRNAKTWPFTVVCTDPSLPVLPQFLVADLNTASDTKQAIKDLDTAIKANALSAELVWGITRDASKGRYGLDLRAVRVRNLTSNEVVVATVLNQCAAFFTVGKRSNPVAAVGTLTVITNDTTSGEVWLNGSKVGSTPWTGKMLEGTVKVEVKWGEEFFTEVHQTTIEAGNAYTVNAAQKKIVIGGLGPAGGIVFFDKGSYSNGWRYLEAAPKDISEGILWYDGDYRVREIIGNKIKTSTEIGSGKVNTAAIIAAQGNGQNAAAVCDYYILNDFDDWFLPSRDELNELFKFFVNFSFSAFVKNKYWSSSQKDYSYAWYKHFGTGQDSYDFKTNKYRLRPIRAF